MRIAAGGGRRGSSVPGPDGRLGGAGAMLGQMHLPCKRPSSWHAPRSSSYLSCLSSLSLPQGRGSQAAEGRPLIMRLLPAGSARTTPSGGSSGQTAAAAKPPWRSWSPVFPLAQLTSYVGGTAVHVVDLCAAWHPTSGSLSDMGRARGRRACRRRHRCRRRFTSPKSSPPPAPPGATCRFSARSLKQEQLVRVLARPIPHGRRTCP